MPKRAKKKASKRPGTPKLRVPTRAEVAKANKSGCRARTALARKYGLSGYVAKAVGLDGPCMRLARRPKRQQ